MARFQRIRLIPATPILFSSTSPLLVLISIHLHSFTAMFSLSPFSSPLKFPLLPSSLSSSKTLTCWYLPSNTPPFRDSFVAYSVLSSSLPKEVSYGEAMLVSLYKLGLQRDASSFPPSSSPLYVAPPQTPATSMRGAESDVMGLLLRERIMFLGSGIDEFVADAIISQLMLLDAQDYTKDIRLFINSPGGSLRFDSCFPALFWHPLSMDLKNFFYGIVFF
ncbi:hypothetical protein KSP40_PGU000245 [Platanthera guangdongensis]|uniref:ATP-dependent Clp protease proteolytic subunit n=1 Tax=Platanthera guangdongensis TaxID=2320717 RepID=A0ABR2LNL0_9ASPA